MGKEFFSVGPTVPVNFKSGELVKSQKFSNGSSATEIGHSTEQTEVELFLENALDKYGKESVIFVCPTVLMTQNAGNRDSFFSSRISSDFFRVNLLAPGQFFC